MIYLIMFIFGAALGSFIGATTWRLHEQEHAKTKKAKEKLSILHGRSMCEHCGHTLAPKDLVPVLSWISLGGECRYCKKKLSWEYPAIELVTGVLFALSYQAWDLSESADYVWFGAWLIILVILLILVVYDLKWLILPNRLIYPLIIVSAFLVVLESIFFGGGMQTIRDSALGLVFAGGSFYLLFAISKGKWIGGGDVKLGVFIGIYLGLSRSILAFILAFNIAALVVLPLLGLKIVSRKTKIPFGPFLISATIIAVLYGSQIIDWYNTTFLYGLF